MFFPLNVPFFEMYGVCNVDKVELEAFLHYFQYNIMQKSEFLSV